MPLFETQILFTEERLSSRFAGHRYNLVLFRGEVIN